jgi:hypothetical protein
LHLHAIQLICTIRASDLCIYVGRSAGPSESAEKVSRLQEALATALNEYVASRDAICLCSRTFPQKFESQPPIPYGRCGGWLTKPCIGTTLTSVGFIRMVVGPRSHLDSWSWACSLRRFTAFAWSCCWGCPDFVARSIRVTPWPSDCPSMTHPTNSGRQFTSQ